MIQSYLINLLGGIKAGNVRVENEGERSWE